MRLKGEARDRSADVSLDTLGSEALNVLELCKKKRWDVLLQVLRTYPLIAMKRIVMNNRITTTILHQLIYAKGHQEHRAKLIRCILQNTPLAASIPNGFGSLPIHVIAQRNTNFSATTKEALICELLSAYPQSLVIAGGKGKRTPLHILFTDYVSLDLASEMVRKGKAACFMKDKHGFLPIHIACSRHCSPDKLELLLEANPASLYTVTNDGSSPLSLAETTATKSHPNYTLILHLKKELARAGKSQSMAHPDHPVPVSPDVKREISCVSLRSISEEIFAHQESLGVLTEGDAYVANDAMSPYYPAYGGPTAEEPRTDTAASLLMHLSHSTVHGV